MRTRIGTLTISLLLVGPAVEAQLAPATSLNLCQGAVKAAANAYTNGYLGAAGVCLQLVSTAIVQRNAADAGTAAAACVAQFRRINDTRALGLSLRERLETAVERKCLPGMPNVTHTLADILGSGAGVAQPLYGEDLNSWCTHYGGDGTINTLDEWIDCVAASHTCGARAALVTQYPRALEWLALVRTSMLGVTPPPTDLTKVADAIAGLDDVAAAIDGPDADGVPNIDCGSSCGDGVADGSEACDGSDLAGASCGSLGYATGTLGCTASCGFDVSGCDCRTATGTAGAGDVLTGKTFSNASSVGITGTMPNNGAVVLTPSTGNQAIAAGYHSGAGYCAGDGDLASGNIRSGVNLFGVSGAADVVNTTSGDAAPGDLAAGKKAWVDGVEITGTATIASGDAVAGDVLTGKTFSNAGTAGIAGTMPNNGTVMLTPTTTNQPIAAGYHDGAGFCAGDSDLLASNIAGGVDLFGVIGTALPAQRLKTGQTTCSDGGGTVIACAGTGQDGELQKGLSVSYTDAGDGTIIDNRTGLRWEKLSDDGSIHDKDTAYVWPNAFKKIQVLNGNASGCLGAGNPDACCTGVGTGSCTPFGGFTDWRLPNVNELQSLVNYGTASQPTVYAAFNTGCVAACTVASCSCTRPYEYWTATSYQLALSQAWWVSFGQGTVGWFNKFSFGYVRAVRAGS
jgi:hypothetical protein